MNKSTRLLTVVLVMLATGCTTGHFRAEPAEPAKPCPPLKTYTGAELEQAVTELDSLPDAEGHGQPMLGVFLDDYLYVRDACR